MRLLTGLARRTPAWKGRTHFRLQQVRWLGQAPQGKSIDNVESAWEEAKRLLYTPSYTYQEFAKRVECARLFLFWGLVAGLTLDLLFRPPKSGYWTSWNLKERLGRRPPAPLPALGPDNMTDATREYGRICNF